MQRVVLGLRKGGELIIPKFSECILDYFTKDSNTIFISCTLEDNFLILAESESGHRLQHSPACSFRALSHEDQTENQEIKQDKKHINVAVSVIVESSDHHILLTKRPSHMRSSPRVWVPPGGHLESGETLLQGGTREVREETGLDIKNCKGHILCLWENVYPLFLGMGQPTNHVVIVYYHVKMSDTHCELQKRIRFDPEEVESCCWLNPLTVSEPFKQAENNFQKQFVLENGVIIERTLDTRTMFNKQLWTNDQSYSGTQFALRMWLKTLKSEATVSKF